MSDTPHHSILPARMTPLAQPIARPMLPPLGLVRGEILAVAVGIATLSALGAAAVTVQQSQMTLAGTELAALFAAAVGTAILLGIALTLTQGLRERARALREAAVEIGLGDLSVRAPSEPLDDLGSLGQSLNAMAERIARMLQAQKDLLAGISHELRSPLARIEVALELIRIEMESERARAPQGKDRRTHAGEDLLQELHEEVRLLEEHIERLLEAQRVGMDRVLLHRSNVDLDALAQTVLRRERHRLERLGFQFELTLDSLGSVVSGDANALDRVISTLIENVIRYASSDTALNGEPCAPSLQIETNRDQNGAILRVMDRGPGLSAEECTRVFEAFYRSPSARARVAIGSGLGLFLVKRAVEAHNGTVQAQPRPGGGLVIEIRLPVVGQTELRETVKIQAVK
jgi:signal transduction histidine kinase